MDFKDADQEPFDVAMEFADNPEPRVSCLLMLDASGSMQGERIAQLNEGVPMRAILEDFKAKGLERYLPRE